MTKLVVTGLKKNAGIYVVDTETPNEFTFINPDNLRPYGVCKWNNFYIVADEFKGLYFFDKDFNVVKKLENVGTGLHDVKVVANTLYLVVSDSNVVKVIDLNSDKLIDKINPNNCSEEEDIHHLNSLQIHKDKMYLSMFGYKGYGKNGSIIQIDLAKYKIEGIVYTSIMHPHSIHFVGDDIFYCESFEKRVYKNDEVILNTDLYPRGIAFDGEYFYVGQSCQRYYQGQTLKSETGSIIVLDLEFNIVKTIELPCEEIYEIIVDAEN